MEVPPTPDFNTLETTEKEKQTYVPKKLTILRIKRKRNEEFLDTIVLEERPTKVPKNKMDQTIAALSSLKISDVEPPVSTVHNNGRKLFRYISSGDFEPNIEEIISKRRELIKVKGTPNKDTLLLDRELRSHKQKNISKSARYNKVNKLRTFTPSLELKNKTGYSLLELVSEEEKKPQKVKSTILLDVPPKIKSSLSPTEPTEPDIVTDYYFLESDNFNLEAHDEVADTPTVVIPVESFDVESDSIFVPEYDEEDNLEYDTDPEDNDYPSTPDEDSIEKNWGGNPADSSEDDNAENSSSDEGGYGYNEGDSNEEYYDYI